MYGMRRVHVHANDEMRRVHVHANDGMRCDHRGKVR